ncbi:hypothetical protein GT354_13560 [Streptomyces sp. SID3343]|nr:hypothetical protein [Streptomyces sp. SID3343]
MARWVVRSRFALVRVTGDSMAPTFADGDRLLIRRTRRVGRGEAVVFGNPVPGFDDGAGELRWLVKRVTATPGDPVPADVRERVPAGPVVPPGALVVRGDGVRSQDSRHFGYVPVSTVLGVVLGRVLAGADDGPTTTGRRFARRDRR